MNTLELYYEDLFIEDLEKVTSQVNEITSFIGSEKTAAETIKRYILPSGNSMNTSDYYSYIPNWNEIQQHFADQM